MGKKTPNYTRGKIQRAREREAMKEKAEIIAQQKEFEKKYDPLKLKKELQESREKNIILLKKFIETENINQ